MKSPAASAGLPVCFMRAALAVLLTALAGLLIATLLLLAGLLTATTLLTAALLTGLVALLLLAWFLIRILVGILILRHSALLRWLLRIEENLRAFPADTITSDEIFRSVWNRMRELGTCFASSIFNANTARTPS
jgi:hypothetical protein